MGEYGVLEDGRAIHPEYNDSIHYLNNKIIAAEDVEIGLGWDFGNTPACAVVQLMPNGQLVVIDEFWTEYMSLRDFAGNIVVPQLDKKYPWWRGNYISYHDPSGTSMNEMGGNSGSILEESGVTSYPAASNKPVLRRDALKYFLTRMPGGVPSFLLSSNTQMIREGLMGKFKYKLIKSTSMSDEKGYEDKPDKNMHSHICESLEYIAMAYAGVSKQPIAKKSFLIDKKWGCS